MGKSTPKYNTESSCSITVLPTDINECEENVAHCHHSCTNLDGGYICTCEIGYALSNDLQSCLGKMW